jgi:23S rRNA (cytosine1962-C5)-methyltransferase
VDLSQPALERGRRAFELTGLRPERHAFVHADAIEWLRRARKRREHFDWIVLDPPSFGTRGKRATFDVASDYVAVASDALALLAPHGKLLAVTHHRKTSPAHFRKMLHEAVRLAGKSLAQMKDLHAPLDFPEGPEGPATKSVLVTLR